MSHKSQTQGLTKSRRDTTALALLGAMLVALALVCGASLSAAGAGAFNHVMDTFGFGRVSAVEAEQHRQAATLTALESVIYSISADVGALNRRVKTTDQNSPAVNERFAMVDTDIAALVAEIKAMRAARAENGEPWVEPVGRLDTALSSARTDVLALRSSLDETSQAFRKDISSINGRLDKLEQAVARDLTSSVRPPVRRKIVRRKPHPRPTPVASNASPFWSTQNAPQPMFTP